VEIGGADRRSMIEDRYPEMHRTRRRYQLTSCSEIINNCRLRATCRADDQPDIICNASACS
jgi:hypothetical protein